MADAGRSDVSISDESVLKELNNEKSRQYIELTVYVASVAILGILGNACALVFYMKQKKQTVTNILIIALTINDLVTSFLIFTNIYDFFHTLTFPSNAWCKTYYLIIHVFSVNSLLFLCAIGFDRFVLVYQWYHWPKALCQLRSIKYVICACGTMSTVVALRDIWLVESTPVDVHVLSANRTITGAHCMHSRRPALKGTITVLHMLDLSILVAVSIFIIVIHSLIARKVATVRKQLEDYSKHSRPLAPNSHTIECGQHHTTNLFEGTADGSQRFESKESVHVKFVTPTETISTSQGKQNKDIQLQSSNRSKRNKNIEKRITIMIFVITAASLLSFVPYFVISFLHTKDHTSSAWEVLAHRSYVINSTLNPFIIGFFNSEFRRFIVDRILFFGWRSMHS